MTQEEIIAELKKEVESWKDIAQGSIKRLSDLNRNTIKVIEAETVPITLDIAVAALYDMGDVAAAKIKADGLRAAHKGNRHTVRNQMFMIFTRCDFNKKNISNLAIIFKYLANL